MAALVAPIPLVVAGVVVAAVATGAAVVLTRGGPAAAPEASPPAVASPTVAPAALSSYDWGAASVPRAACDPGATGEVTLVKGQGKVTAASGTYLVSEDPAPAVGELDGHQAAALQLTCLLEGANGVGGRPIAVYLAQGDDVRLAGVVRNQDLGTAPPTASALVPSSEKFVQGELLVVGTYLQGDDPRCCPSGTGWTTIRLQDGALAPSGVITAGEPPATLPTPGANLITYPGGVTVQTAADLPKLVGAPDDFQQFVLTQVPPAEAPCNQPGKVTVLTIRSDGYAVGSSVYHCAQAGHEVLWAKTDGAWKQVAATEDLFDCATLHAATFPAALLGPDPHCADGQGSYVVYDDGTAPPSPTASPSPTPGALPSGATLIDYRDKDGHGVAVTSQAHVAKLHDSPDDFKAFVLWVLTTMTAGMTSAAIAQCHPAVEVDAVRTDGFAIGGETACGGAQDLWTNAGGSWRTVLGMQDLPACRDLRGIHFPPEVFDKGAFDQCVENDGRTVTYAG
ncbi:MAG: hypothetical protein JWO46_3018 [Nocardioidaceae bacterium]|nr:hypothetical protein [Nocardioidaceae bacterium]